LNALRPSRRSASTPSSSQGLEEPPSGGFEASAFVDLDEVLSRLDIANRALANLLAEGSSTSQIARARAAVVDIQMGVERLLGLTSTVLTTSPTPGTSRTAGRAAYKPAPSARTPSGALQESGQSTESDLAAVIQTCLSASPDLTARELCGMAQRQLGRPVARKEVNAVLYKDARFMSDGADIPRWRTRG